VVNSCRRPDYAVTVEDCDVHVLLLLLLGMMIPSDVVRSSITQLVTSQPLSPSFSIRESLSVCLFAANCHAQAAWEQ